jgi:hypothetical protein
LFWYAAGCEIISRVQSIFNDSTLTFVPPESDRWLCSRPVAEKAISETHGPGSATERLPDWNSLHVLATGRIASCFVGARDVETVGQFWQRYDDLQLLDTNSRTLIEAETHGWKKLESNVDFLVLMR